MHTEKEEKMSITAEQTKLSEARKLKRKAYVNGYNQTPEAKASRRRWNRSDKAKAVKKKYKQTPKGKISEKKYKRSSKGKISDKEYNQSSKGKTTREKWKQSPEGKAIRKKYSQSDKFKTYQEKYKQSPKRKLDMKKYNQPSKGKLARTIIKSRRRERLKKLVTAYTTKDWKDLLEEANGICSKCNVFVGKEKLTLDHIIPISKAVEGYVYTKKNIQPLCKSCNTSKGNKV